MKGNVDNMNNSTILISKKLARKTLTDRDLRKAVAFHIFLTMTTDSNEIRYSIPNLMEMTGLTAPTIRTRRDDMIRYGIASQDHKQLTLKPLCNDKEDHYNVITSILHSIKEIETYLSLLIVPIDKEKKSHFVNGRTNHDNGLSYTKMQKILRMGKANVCRMIRWGESLGLIKRRHHYQACYYNVNQRFNMVEGSFETFNSLKDSKFVNVNGSLQVQPCRFNNYEFAVDHLTAMRTDTNRYQNVSECTKEAAKALNFYDDVKKVVNKFAEKMKSAFLRPVWGKGKRNWEIGFRLANTYEVHPLLVA